MLLESMRGTDEQQSRTFSYLSPEQRVRKDHPLRAMRMMVDEVLRSLSREFDRMYSSEGGPSIAPEKLLRALVVQMLYSIRSERLLTEEIEYSILFRWFVGLNLDEEVWEATVFTKNRDRLLEADVAKLFLQQVVEQARASSGQTRPTLRRIPCVPWLWVERTGPTSAAHKGDRRLRRFALSSKAAVGCKSQNTITFPRFSPGLPISRSGVFQTLLPVCGSPGIHRCKRPG